MFIGLFIPNKSVMNPQWDPLVNSVELKQVFKRLMLNVLENMLSSDKLAISKNVNSCLKKKKEKRD